VPKMGDKVLKKKRKKKNFNLWGETTRPNYFGEKFNYWGRDTGEL
jgi:hypothetical protein